MYCQAYPDPSSVHYFIYHFVNKFQRSKFEPFKFINIILPWFEDLKITSGTKHINSNTSMFTFKQPFSVSTVQDVF